MDSLNWILSFLALFNIGSSVNGSACSKVNRAQDLTECLKKAREVLLEPDTFWFGNSYTQRCPDNDNNGVFCLNPKPAAHSIHVRLFSSTAYTAGLDRFLELEFQSSGKNYNACGNTFKTTESWSYDADPTSDTVVTPWYVKNFPISVKWTYNAGEYYTLMVYDAGYLTSNGLYINIQGDDISSAEIIRHYGQPLIGTDIKNPYLFLLFKQNGPITLNADWRTKMTSGNIAGAWTIEQFSSAVNMAGLVATNWIVVTGDEWAAQTMLDQGGPYALCPVFATKALHEKSRPFIPRDTQLSVWIDFEFMIPVDQTIDVCCKNTTYRARNFKLNPLGNELLSSWDTRSETPHVLTFTKLGYYNKRKDFTGDMYTILSVDPDVNNRLKGTEDRPLLHGLVTNIVNGNLKEGEKALSWSGPFPQDNRPHYYYTLLYKQQANINATQLSKNYTGDCSSELSGKCLFNINLAVSENNLTLVGTTWFRSQKDAYVLKRLLEQPGSSEATVCNGQPEYSDPCTTGSTTAVLPSLLNVCILVLLSLVVL